MELEYVALGIVVMLAIVYLALWFKTRREQNGFRPDLTLTVSAQLTDQVIQRKEKTSAFGEKVHKLTKVTYSYQVEGETYHCECTLVDHFKPVPASTKVICQRKRPQISVLPEFEKVDQKGMSVFYLSGSILFWILAAMYVNFAL